MSGHVLIDNETRQALHVDGCGSLFQVVLGNDNIHPDVLWTQCLQLFTIPIGESSYPVRVDATYLGCSPGRPQGTLLACKPNGQTPDLPPGDYQARLFQSSKIAPSPPPIAVHLTAQRPAP
jgi:hypothetical protein